MFPPSLLLSANTSASVRSKNLQQHYTRPWMIQRRHPTVQEIKQEMESLEKEKNHKQQQAQQAGDVCTHTLTFS